MKHEIQKFLQPTKTTYEKGGGQKLVNTAGYIPAKDQIENMILAGERLSQYRQETYFDVDGNPFMAVPSPVTRFDFDEIDAMQLKRENQRKADQLIEETREKYKNEQIAKSEQKPAPIITPEK